MTPEEQAAADAAAKKASDAADKQAAADKKAADKKAADDAAGAKSAADAKAQADATAKTQAEADAKAKADAAAKAQADAQAAVDAQAKISAEVEAKRTAQLKEAAQKNLPPGFVRPTIGRIVHFYPHPDDKQARANGAEFIPGIVTGEYGDHRVDLRIFPAIEEKSMYTRREKIPHQSKADAPEVITTGTWDWPPRV
jgi:hypothetical protein